MRRISLGITYHNVAPDHGDIVISVRPVHLVHEAKRMKQLVNHHLEVDTTVLLEPNLHPASAWSVGHLGVASSTSGDDVNIVSLVSAGNKPRD